ncbi:hypothetical protein Ssi02_05070 [Sinosporangium siamense]|uniref:Uncharacterized protein n=1 Tax=Sinosporangium siamense TaxID=1367973 RepID=A0A919RAA5_9ACTN|nr:hypothetical protein Ssi02_05070 [Sinosporangium siamense]
MLEPVLDLGTLTAGLGSLFQGCGALLGGQGRKSHAGSPRISVDVLGREGKLAGLGPSGNVKAGFCPHKIYFNTLRNREATVSR